MSDNDLAKAFGSRVKQLRKQKHWQQKELATQTGIRYQLLNKYESGSHVPPAGTLIKLAEALDTTIDYLLTGNPQEETSLRNARLFKRFQALEELSGDDQETIIKIIDAMLAKQRVTGAIKTMDERAQ